MQESGRERLTIMMVTPLDYGTFDNIEHYMARYYLEQGDRVVMLSKVMNRSRSLLASLWQTLTCSYTRPVRPDGLDLFLIDPFCNYYAGVVRAADASAEVAQSRSARLLRSVLRMVAPAGLVRDVFFLPCFLVVALLRCERCDVCIGLGPWGSLVAWALARLGRARIWMYKDRDYEPDLMTDPVRRRYTALLEAALVRRTDLLVTIGHRLGALRHHQAGRRAAFIPCGVDCDRFAEVSLRPRTGATLVYVGKVLPWSGLELVVRALPAIAAQIPAVRLRIIGDDLPAVREQLATLADRMGVRDRVTFCGAVPHAQIAQALAEDADVGLANSEPTPYRRYAYPLKVLEYMAAGIPVIATADTEAAEILSRADCGTSCAYETSAFAAATVSLLSDEAWRRRCSRNGISASREMTWSKILTRERALIWAALRPERAHA